MPSKKSKKSKKKLPIGIEVINGKISCQLMSISILVVVQLSEIDFPLLQKNLQPFEDADDTADHFNNLLQAFTSSSIDMIIYEAKLLKIDTANSLEKCVDVIFENAINNQSQSIFANLCTRLCFPSVPVCKETQKMVTFKEQILEKTRKEVLNFLEQQTLINSGQTKDEAEWRDDGDDKVVQNSCLKKLRRPIALFKFIGELYLVEFLPSSFIHQCASHLLDETFCNESTLESFYAILKIAGKKLGIFDKIDLTELFTLLAERKTSITTNPHAKFMIEELCEIRSNQWEPVNEVDWIALYNLFLCDVEEKLYVLELWYGK